MDQSISELLRQARTIAVVGMSDRPFRDSNRIGSFLQEEGYEVFPVNPTIESAAGIPALPDLASIPKPVDIVDVFRHPSHAMEIVQEAIGIGAKAVWFQLGAEDEEAARVAREAGLVVVLGRCIAVEYRLRGVGVLRERSSRTAA